MAESNSEWFCFETVLKSELKLNICMGINFIKMILLKFVCNNYIYKRYYVL